MKAMVTSESGIRMIKSFEGLRMEAYRCPAGILTIGYGHTGNVREGQVCTEKEAEMWLIEDIREAEKAVSNIKASRLLRQNEFDALVSFAFNVGVNAFRDSTLLKLIKQGADEATIRAEFGKWCHSGGRRIDGLVRRRKAEADMFFGC